MVVFVFFACGPIFCLQSKLLGMAKLVRPFKNLLPILQLEEFFLLLYLTS